MTYIALGERLKVERERLGYNQTDFAALVGASKRSQVGWEQERSFPDARALATWASEGMDTTYVLTGERSGSEREMKLPPDEQLLLEAYRGLSALKRKKVLAGLLTGEINAGSIRRTTEGVSVSGSGNRVSGRDYHE